MPIVEYEPGSAFPGVIGRTTDESSPAWPAAGAREARARRTCCSSCWTTPASGSSAATAARSRRRTSTRSPRTGCATTTCTRRRCARRAARASSPAATTTATGWPRSPSSRRAIPGYDGVDPVRERVACRRCCVEQGYNTYMVGKWHLTPSQPGDGRRAVRPLAAGPRLRALLRLPRRRHEPVVSGPRLRQPPGRAAARRRRRATT